MRRIAVTMLIAVGLFALSSGAVLAQEDNDDYPPAAPTVSVSDTTVVPGQQITVMGQGWMAGTQVEITIAGIHVGTATVAADGTFQTTVTVPDLRPGDHILRVSGIGADGEARTVDVVLTVVAPAAAPAPAPALAVTGGNITIGAALGFALLAFGGLALYGARRQRVKKPV